LNLKANVLFLWFTESYGGWIVLCLIVMLILRVFSSYMLRRNAMRLSPKKRSLILRDRVIIPLYRQFSMRSRDNILFRTVSNFYIACVIRRYFPFLPVWFSEAWRGKQPDSLFRRCLEDELDRANSIISEIDNPMQKQGAKQHFKDFWITIDRVNILLTIIASIATVVALIITLTS